MRKQIAKFESDTNLQVLECATINEAIPIARQLGSCLIVCHASQQDQLVKVLTLLKSLAEGIAKKTVFVLMSVAFKQADVLVQRLRDYGCSEVLVEPVVEKVLNFKIDRYTKGLPAYKRKLAQKNSASAQKQVKKDANVTTKNVAALELESDCWLSHDRRPRRVADRWMLKLFGPGPNFGRWVEIPSGSKEQQAWQWVPVDTNNDPFIQEEGSWVFRGNRLPEFHDYLWWFTGMAPSLEFYYQKQSYGAKFKVGDSGDLLLALDSDAAKRAEPIIQASWQKVIKRNQQAAQASANIESEKDANGEGTPEVKLDAESSKARTAKPKLKTENRVVKKIDALNLESDFWLYDKIGTAKFQSGKWTIRVRGPSGTYGSWMKLEGKHKGVDEYWQWVPASAENDPFHKEEGSWVYRGAQPMLMDNAWVFTGAEPSLGFFYGGESFGDKINSDSDGSLLVATDSAAAKSFEDTILISLGMKKAPPPGKVKPASVAVEATSQDPSSSESENAEQDNEFQEEFKTATKKPKSKAKIKLDPEAEPEFAPENESNSEFDSESDFGPEKTPGKSKKRAPESDENIESEDSLESSGKPGKPNRIKKKISLQKDEPEFEGAQEAESDLSPSETEDYLDIQEEKAGMEFDATFAHEEGAELNGRFSKEKSKELKGKFKKEKSDGSDLEGSFENENNPGTELNGSFSEEQAPENDFQDESEKKKLKKRPKLKSKLGSQSDQEESTQEETSTDQTESSSIGKRKTSKKPKLAASLGEESEAESDLGSPDFENPAAALDLLANSKKKATGKKLGKGKEVRIPVQVLKSNPQSDAGTWELVGDASDGRYWYAYVSPELALAVEEQNQEFVLNWKSFWVYAGIKIPEREEGDWVFKEREPVCYPRFVLMPEMLQEYWHPGASEPEAKAAIKKKHRETLEQEAAGDDPNPFAAEEQFLLDIQEGLEGQPDLVPTDILAELQEDLLKRDFSEDDVLGKEATAPEDAPVEALTPQQEEKKALNAKADLLVDKFKGNDPAIPTMGPVSVAFFMSELMMREDYTLAEISETYCRFISSALAGLKIDLWLARPNVDGEFDSNSWALIAQSIPDTGGRILDFVKAVAEPDQKEAFQERGRARCGIYDPETQKLIGVIVVRGEGSDKVSLNYLRAIGLVATGILRSRLMVALFAKTNSEEAAA